MCIAKHCLTKKKKHFLKKKIQAFKSCVHNCQTTFAASKLPTKAKKFGYVGSKIIKSAKHSRRLLH